MSQITRLRIADAVLSTHTPFLISYEIKSVRLDYFSHLFLKPFVLIPPHYYVYMQISIPDMPVSYCVCLVTTSFSKCFHEVVESISTQTKVVFVVIA